MTAKFAIPLVKTKLFIPRVRQNIVSRTRIIQFLNHGLNYPLILVSSLAGSGKTTALSEWISQLSIPCAWVSLDEGDNDLSRFLSYFVAALHSILPHTSKTVLEGFDPAEPASIEFAMTSLINNLSEEANDFVLVLDDYHLIQSHPVHQAISFLLEHQPLQMHLAITTRMDPPFPLSQMRSRGKILELRMDQLRFTAGETSEYLNQRIELDLSESDLLVLLSRTEGWIASLQMAALSISNNPDGKRFVQAFSGSNRFVMDYLMEEVLSRLPEPVQAFLLQTSILERLNASLCSALCYDENELNAETPSGSSFAVQARQAAARKMLEYLEHNNLFIVPLDEERNWYRYHHLFTSLLRSKLAHSPFHKHILHARAAHWYQQNGFPEEAIHHALAAQDYPRAANLVEAIAEGVWLKGEYFRLMEWIKAIPVNLVCTLPRLCIWNAWSLTQTGLLKDARVWLEAAEQAVQKQASDHSPPSALPADIQAMRYEIATLHALAAGLSQDYDRAVELASWVMENPPHDDQKLSRTAQCHILHGLSSMYFVSGELDKAERACLETIRLSKEVGFTLRHLHAVNKLAYVYKATGQLHRSFMLLENTLNLFQKQGFAHNSITNVLRCRLMDLLYEWGRSDEMHVPIDENLATGETPQAPYLCVDLYNIQARDALLKGDLASAQTALDQSVAMTQMAYIWPGLTWQTEAIQVRLWLKQGYISRAAAWANEQPADDPCNLPFSGESLAIARARILMAQGAREEALRLLNRLAGSAEAGGRQGSLVEIRVLEALTLHAAGCTKEAAAVLDQALSMVEPEGYIRTFLDEGSAMVNLLLQVIQSGTFRQRACGLRLLAAAGEANPMAAAQNARSHPVSNAPDAFQIEPLSRRELEVLDCMARGLSNRETAGHLMIETSTVKRHINNIFAKMGVSSRVQAINKANESKII